MCYIPLFLMNVSNSILVNCVPLSVTNGFSNPCSRVPHVELEEMGPSLDLAMRRSHLAPDDLMKQACRQPKAMKV